MIKEIIKLEREINMTKGEIIFTMSKEKTIKENKTLGRIQIITLLEFLIRNLS